MTGADSRSLLLLLLLLHGALLGAGEKMSDGALAHRAGGSRCNPQHCLPQEKDGGPLRTNTSLHKWPEYSFRPLVFEKCFTKGLES